MVCTKPFFTLPKIDFINNTISGFNNINPYDTMRQINDIDQYLLFIFYSFFIFFVFPIFIFMIKRPKGHIHIIRGLHGVGKNTLANKIIDHYDPCEYIHIDMYDNWNHNSNKKTHYVQLMKCNNNSIQDYIKSMEMGIETIIITNPFVKKWEYNIYIELAKKYNYDWTIYQIVSESKDHARYFETRSNHKLPILKNVYLYDKWENDNRAITIDADYSELPGDSLPQHNSERQLDIELENYMKGK